MENNDDGSNLLGRRRAIQLLGVGLTAAGGLLSVTGCKKDEAMAPASPKPVPAAAPTPTAAAAPAGDTAGGLNCKDKAPIDEGAATLRRALQYQEKSTTPDKNCVGCAQYIAGTYGACGGCKLFGGAVNPQGICLSYAPINAAAPTAPN